ncbi:MAG: FAD-dependent oxidoreductase [Sulfuricellaceae bacterium]|jgi:2-octaprenyl-6-methoxyphenol hydroxylase
MESHVDVLIVGGGPAGASLALALRDSGLDVVVLEAQREVGAADDPRALALSYGTRLILQQLDVWRRLRSATPIETVHVSQRGGFGRALLKADESGLPALGYVVDYPDLNAALQSKVAEAELAYLSGATVTALRSGAEAAEAEFDHGDGSHRVRAKLLVLADGGRCLDLLPDMAPSVKDYHQCAVLARVKSEQPNRHIAYERFTPLGPIALLPSGDRWALVWTVSTEEAGELMALDDDAFLARLHDRFGDRAGRFTAVGPRASWPLALKQTRPVTGQRLAVVGNAAQILHPFAGQGFNLALRDAWELADEVLKAAPAGIGDEAMLRAYRGRREWDTKGGIAFTDSVLSLFTNDVAPLQAARGLGLTLLDTLPGAKPLLLNRLIYGARS